MEIKFFLNKFIKINNIEDYTLASIDEMRDAYDRFLEKTEGIDPDYPYLRLGQGEKGKVLGTRGTNIYSVIGEGESKEDVYDIIRNNHGRQ